MGNQLNELFTASCGVFGQWGVSIFRKDSVAEECTFFSPWALVGSRDNVNFLLADPAVSRRHAYLQVLPGGLFCIDLDSRTGVRFGAEKRDSGWLRRGQRLHVGPYALELLPTSLDGWFAPSQWPHSDPLSERMSEMVPLPPFVVEVVQAGKIVAKGKMNRVLALVGRSPRCLFYVSNPALSKFHCSLVRTPTGLWVVDLLSRAGTSLNGHRVRFARIQEGDQVQLGEFSLRFRRPYRNAKVVQEIVAGGVEVRNAGDRRSTIDVRPSPEENTSLPLPPNEPSRALEPVPLSEAETAAVMPRAARTVLAAPDERVGAEWSMLIALVSQFNLMQQQMFDQFQESMLMNSRMFTSLHQDQMALVREELDQLRGLTGELRTLQDELTGQPARTWPGVGPTGRSAAPVNNNGAKNLPTPVGPGASDGEADLDGKAATFNAVPLAKPLKVSGNAAPVGPPPDGSPEDMHVWLNQRISALQEERQTRWDKLLGRILGN